VLELSSCRIAAAGQLKLKPSPLRQAGGGAALATGGAAVCVVAS
jgi:hypothetical protein